MFLRALCLSLVTLLAAAGAGCDTLEDIAHDILGKDGKNPPPPPGPACASTADCAAGTACTVDRGVCNPPPGCRDGAICPAVCYGTCEPAGTPAGACKVDGDCRLTSDYCTGCDCRALGPGQPDPTCTGPGVQCLVDPCRAKTATCQAGRCAVADAPTR